MVKVQSLAWTIDKNIVKQNYNKLTEILPKYDVHHCLKCGRSIEETEHHDEIS